MSLADSLPLFRGGLTMPEKWWRDHYLWLQSKGYQLGQRYHPDWVPSWLGTSKKHKDCEDGGRLYLNKITFAIKDNKPVALKRIYKSQYPRIVEILSYLSKDPLGSKPQNHTVPLLNVLDVPGEADIIILVMPYLRWVDDPPFDTFGEVVECFRQIFEGVQFLHQHCIVHRKCIMAIMMGGQEMYPEGCNLRCPALNEDMSGKAKCLTRTEAPPKYYIVGFGLAIRFASDDPNSVANFVSGGDRTVPEIWDGPVGSKFKDLKEPINPFPIDVYNLGSLIKDDYMDKRSGFGFMEPLVNDMMQADPSKRPTIDEVVARYEVIRKQLSSCKLRSKVPDDPDEERTLTESLRTNWKRTLYVLKGVPPVPPTEPLLQ